MATKKTTTQKNAQQGDQDTAHTAQETHQESASQQAGHPCCLCYNNVFNAAHQKEFTHMNTEALSQQQRQLVDMMFDITQISQATINHITTMKHQFMHQSMEDYAAFVQEAAFLGPEFFKKTPLKAQESIHKMVAHTSEVASVITKAQSDIYNKVQDHFSHAFETMTQQAMRKP